MLTPTAPIIYTESPAQLRLQAAIFALLVAFGLWFVWQFVTMSRRLPNAADTTIFLAIFILMGLFGEIVAARQCLALCRRANDPGWIEIDTSGMRVKGDNGTTAYKWSDLGLPMVDPKAMGPGGSAFSINIDSTNKQLKLQANDYDADADEICDVIAAAQEGRLLQPDQ